VGDHDPNPVFNPKIVSHHSCHGVEPGMRAGETHAKINQDRGCVVYPFSPTKGTNCDKYVNALFCVFDGHGAVGEKVSNFVMENIQETLHQMLDPLEQENINSDKDKSVSDCLKSCFVQTDDALRKAVDADLSGTTAVVCLCRWERSNPKCAKMFVANAGDSRAVLAKRSPDGMPKAENLSEDQKPDSPAELRRIKARGGFVSPPEEEWGGPARVWLDGAMTLPGLAMARSIGDHLVKTVGVIAEPEVKVFNLDADKDAFIVMASDGVWEFIDSQEAVDIIAADIDGKGCDDACKSLINTAVQRWRAEEGDYRDDITAMCIKFPQLLQNFEATA